MVGYGDNGSVVGPQITPTGGITGVASGVWSLGEVAEAERDSIWPDVDYSNDFDLIADIQNATAGAVTMTFSNIPQSYKHLQLICAGTGYYNGGQVVNLQLNNVSTGTQTTGGFQSQLANNAAGMTAYNKESQTKLFSTSDTGIYSDETEKFEPGIWTYIIPNYTSSTMRKTLDCQFNGARYDTAIVRNIIAAGRVVQQTMATTPITSLVLTATNGWSNKAAGISGKYITNAQLYGSK